MTARISHQRIIYLEWGGGLWLSTRARRSCFPNMTHHLARAHSSLLSTHCCSKRLPRRLGTSETAHTFPVLGGRALTLKVHGQTLLLLQNQLLQTSPEKSLASLHTSPELLISIAAEQV